MSHADYQSLVDRLADADADAFYAAAAGTSAPAATTTSRMLRRIELPLVSRPTFRSTPQNLRSFGRWWLANASLVRRYYEACEAQLRASGEWIAPGDPAADLEAFAETLYQSERWARAQSHACAPLPTRRNEP